MEWNCNFKIIIAKLNGAERIKKQTLGVNLIPSCWALKRRRFAVGIKSLLSSIFDNVVSRNSLRFSFLIDLMLSSSTPSRLHFCIDTFVYWFMFPFTKVDYGWYAFISIWYAAKTKPQNVFVVLKGSGHIIKIYSRFVHTSPSIQSP